MQLADPARGRRRDVSEHFGVSRGGGTLVFRSRYSYPRQPPQKPAHPGEDGCCAPRHRATVALVTTQYLPFGSSSTSPTASRSCGKDAAESACPASTSNTDLAPRLRRMKDSQPAEDDEVDAEQDDHGMKAVFRAGE